MSRHGNSGYIGKDKRTAPAGVYGLQKQYVERLGGNFLQAAPDTSTSYTLGDGYVISSIPAMHWDASTIAGVDDQDPVSTWTSREGNDYELLQTTAAQQFTYESASSNLNNKPSLRSSNGSQEMMTATNFLPADTITMPVTLIMAVYALEGAPYSQSHFGGKDTSGDDVNSFKPYSPRGGKWNIYMSPGPHSMGGTFSEGAQAVTWELNPSATTYNFVNLARTTISTAVSTNNPFNYQLSVGSANNSTRRVITDTELAEFIFFNEIFSDTEMSGSDVSGGTLYTIITYLQNKYGIS